MRMPTDGKTNTYGFLDQLSTEQLLDLIRAGFEASEDGDDGLTERILEVIEEKEKTRSTGFFPDVGQAWKNFQDYYLPDGEDCPFIPMKDSDLAAFEEAQDKPAKPRRGRLLKRLVAVAAVVAVTFSSMVAAQAVGFDIFGMLARWTSETFHFATGTAAGAGSSESRRLQTLVQVAFDSCGIPVPAPAWYPEGTALAQDIDIIEDEESSMVMCVFTLEGARFSIIAQQYYKDSRIPIHTFEKDDESVEEHSSNGRLFYIMSNLSQSRAVYSGSKIVMTIEGDISLENLKRIIDSIGE